MVSLIKTWGLELSLLADSTTAGSFGFGWGEAITASINQRNTDSKAPQSECCERLLADLSVFDDS